MAGENSLCCGKFTPQSHGSAAFVSRSARYVSLTMALPQGKMLYPLDALLSCLGQFSLMQFSLGQGKQRGKWNRGGWKRSGSKGNDVLSEDPVFWGLVVPFKAREELSICSLMQKWSQAGGDPMHLFIFELMGLF